MNVKDLIVSEEAQDGFYPTPSSLADKLLDDINWRLISDVLEPSAGKGDIVRSVIEQYRKEYGKWAKVKINIDCIEIDPYLRSILKYEYCGQKRRELFERIKELEAKQSWDSVNRVYGKLTDEEKAEREDLKNECELIETGDVHVVHDDFLAFDSRKNYGLIVMNPPFSNGDRHLLKAIEMQERWGGEIRCILNAETIRNPYTNSRRLLARKLQDLKADVEFIENAFSNSERGTDVEVAIIKINIGIPHRNSSIFDNLKRAAEVNDPVEDDVTDMTVADFMSRIVTQFNVEVDAGVALINEYIAMKPYILKSFCEGSNVGSPTLSIVVNGENSYGDYPSVNKYIKLVRSKYWEALFSNKEFVGRLTNNLREQYQKKISALADYDFTAFNIQQIADAMSSEMSNGIQETIVSLFDKFTDAHSWYPECEKNIHYYNGWKTNKAHKVNSKVIVPIRGVFSDSAWCKKTFDVRSAESLISDIEKVFNYLDGNRTENVDLHGILTEACESGQTKNIRCKYFDVNLYKKGTMHIKFRDQSIIDRFNIYCCRKKNWLPPNYGKVDFSDMTPTEKDIVTSFHEGKNHLDGGKKYQNMLIKSQFYLAEPTSEIKMISAPEYSEEN